MWQERLGKLKKLIRRIGSRTRDLNQLRYRIPRLSTYHTDMTERIYEIQREDKFWCHDMHTNFRKYWFRRSTFENEGNGRQGELHRQHLKEDIWKIYMIHSSCPVSSGKGQWPNKLFV
jgi:hypothetical protein